MPDETRSTVFTFGLFDGIDQEPLETDRMTSEEAVERNLEMSKIPGCSLIWSRFDQARKED